MNVLQQKLKTNKVEEAGYSLLDRMGLLYFNQYLIANKFCVDAFFYSESLIVQFDGDYWHGNPDKFPVLDERQKKRSRLDKSQDAYMDKCGYRVLRIWETDIKKHPEEVKARILAALSRR
jgi:very-short-patch-repair endonuclease